MTGRSNCRVECDCILAYHLENHPFRDDAMRTLLTSIRTYPQRYLLICVLGVYVLTLYPYNFQQRNNVSFADGLTFKAPGTAYTLHSHEALSSLYQFSILLDLTPEFGDLPHIGHIFSSAENFYDQNFAIGQSHESLIIQFFSRDSHQYNEVTVPDVFHQRTRIRIAITFNGTTLRCFINGVKKADRMTGPMALTQWDATYPIVLGSDPNGTEQWEGSLFTVALIDRSLPVSEVQRPDLIFKKYSCIIHYNFDKRASLYIPSTGTDTDSLYVPEFYSPLRRMTLFDTFRFLGRQRLYIRDVVANIFFFLPVGFFSAMRFRQRFKKNVAILTFSVIVGLALSVSVELLQILLPSRFSSMIDVLSNTAGTGLGALLSLRFFVSRTGSGAGGTTSSTIPAS
jgi:hypothetical protein